MTLARNKDVVQKSYEVVWNKHNLDAVEELYASDYITRSGLPGVSPDRKGFKDWVNLTTHAFPDIEFTVKDQLAEGNEVVTRWEAHGTQQGEFMGIPASGKEISVTGLSINRLQDGKIKESWVEWDSLGLLQQLGALPGPTA
ncbi:MAG: ester cyclase [Chloroflexi bacterium]|nr:ester cyclase [Chloroflexota bacterium]